MHMIKNRQFKFYTSSSAIKHLPAKNLSDVKRNSKFLVPPQETEDTEQSSKKWQSRKHQCIAAHRLAGAPRMLHRGPISLTALKIFRYSYMYICV